MPLKVVVPLLCVKVPLFVYEPLIERLVGGATTTAPALITKFVEEAALLKVLVPAPVKATCANVEVAVRLPEIICAEEPLTVVVPPLYSVVLLLVYDPPT